MNTAAPTEEWIAVTPLLAEQWLSHNIDNRNLRTQRVVRFAEDMESGRWANYHPHGISFDSSGRLIDGQHRLHAISLSGQTITMRVTSNLPPEIHSVIDIGMPRTAGEILRREGIKDPSHVAALVTTIFWFDEYPDTSWNNCIAATKAHIHAFALDYENEINDAIQAAAGVYRSARIPRTAYGTLHFLAERAGLMDAWPGWHEGVAVGAGLMRRDPRLTLRNYFSNQARRREKRDRWERQKHLAIMMKAFSKYVEGQPLAVVRFEQYELPMPSLSDIKTPL